MVETNYSNYEKIYQRVLPGKVQKLQKGKYLLGLDETFKTCANINVSQVILYFKKITLY